jgi:hypothetical protein
LYAFICLMRASCPAHIIHLNVFTHLNNIW